MNPVSVLFIRIHSLENNNVLFQTLISPQRTHEDNLHGPSYINIHTKKNSVHCAYVKRPQKQLQCSIYRAITVAIDKHFLQSISSWCLYFSEKWRPNWNVVQFYHIWSKRDKKNLKWCNNDVTAAIVQCVECNCSYHLVGSQTNVTRLSFSPLEIISTAPSKTFSLFSLTHTLLLPSPSQSAFREEIANSLRRDSC